MNIFGKIAASTLIAIAFVAPTASIAAVTTSNAEALVHAVPSGSLLSIIGHSGGNFDLSAATLVRVINVNDIYDGETLAEVTDALAITKRFAVEQLRLKRSAELVQLGIDGANVLAIEHMGSAVNVYIN